MTTRLKPVVAIDKRRRTLKVMCRDFQRSASVLSWRKVRVELKPFGPAPAWSYPAESEVFIAEEEMPLMVGKLDYAVVTGLLNHELGHLLYSSTPALMHLTMRAVNDTSLLGTTLMQNAGNSNDAFSTAYNILEDQRQEALLVGQYPHVRPYLTAAVRHYYVGAGREYWERLFLLTRGRRYLSRGLRVRARRTYKYQEDIPEIIRIIDEYRMLDIRDYRDLRRAFHLVSDMAPLVAKGLADDPGRCSCGLIVNIGTSSSVFGMKREATPDEALKGRAAQNATGTPGDDEASSDDGEGAGEQTDQEVVDEALNDIVNDPGVSKDYSAMRQRVNAQVINPDTAELQTWSGRAPSAAPVLARKTAHQLRRLEEDADPHWLTHQSTGRLNIGRAMHGDFGSDDLYDSWREGLSTGMDLELVIALDVSGSMDPYLSELELAAWVSKRAADDVRAHCTILAFGTQHYVVYEPGDQAVPNRFPRLHNAGGGTSPGAAFVDAHSILVTSPRKVKRFVVMTDGQWSPGISASIETPFCNAEEVILDLNARGVGTALAFLESDTYTPEIEASIKTMHQHSCQEFRHITSMEEFPMFVRDELVDAFKGKRKRK